MLEKSGFRVRQWARLELLPGAHQVRPESKKGWDFRFSVAGSGITLE